MPDQVHCPDCRRLQRPREEFGRLICPECDAILSPGVLEAAPAPGASALDEAMPAQTRPTGAMTLLRNNLRSEEKDKQSSWLENILPRRAKGPADPEAVSPNRGPREPEGMAAGKKSPPGPHCPVPETPDDSPTPPPIVAEKTAGPRFAEETAPAHREGADGRRVSLLGTSMIVAVCAIASVALLPGHETWAGVLFLLTVALIGASSLAILHRRQGQRASWQGFALFGSGYLLMAFVPSFPHQAGLELPTSRLVRLAYARATASAEDPRDSFQIMKAAPGVVAGSPSAADAGERPRQLASMVPAAAGNLREFLIVGHCLFTLLAALIGSAIARWLYRSNLAHP